MWEIIQRQQAQLDALQGKVETTEEKVEATGEAVEQIAASGSSTPGWWQRTSLGGYGELHYNGGNRDQVDFHRFVVFVNHEFTDSVRFFSEVELEHALSGNGKPGEVELEQAFLEFDVAEHHSLRAGVQLVPVGILNETHEPPTFYGVERNSVESQIIPSTWWEAGVSAQGELGEGFAYTVMYSSGLEVATTGGSAYNIRSGRQKVANAVAKDGAVTGRLTYSGLPGVSIGVSGQYQEDITQSVMPTSATLFEGHIDGSWEAGPGRIGFRALAARWDLDASSATTGGRNEQYGWYVEPSYRFPVSFGEVGVFARYAEWDNVAGDSTSSVNRQTHVGANFWPTPDTVLKLDYQFDDNDAGGSAEDNRLNLGVGYQF